MPRDEDATRTRAREHLTDARRAITAAQREQQRVLLSGGTVSDRESDLTEALSSLCSAVEEIATALDEASS